MRGTQDKLISGKRLLIVVVVLVAALALATAGLFANLSPSKSTDQIAQISKDNVLDIASTNPEQQGLTVPVSDTSSNDEGTAPPTAQTASDAMQNAASSIEVSLLVECKAAYKVAPDYISTLSNKGVLQKQTTLKLPTGSTIGDALAKSGLAYSVEYGYVSSIGELAAGALGEGSAWFCSVNGKYPTKPFDQYQLKAADKIVWHYSINLGKDIDLAAAAKSVATTDDGDDDSDDDAIQEPSISGIITNSQAEPLEAIIATAYYYDGVQDVWLEADSVISDEDGSYQFAELEAGTYKLGFTDETSSYLSQYWQGSKTLATAAPIDFDPEIPLADLDVELIKAASMSGEITDATAEPIDGIEVVLYKLESEAWQENVTATTAPDGSFAFWLLEQGSYTIWFSDPQDRYLPKYWTDASALTDADVIDIASGEDATLKNTTLTKAASISGKVQSTDNNPISSATVKLYEAGANGQSPTLAAQVQTDELGNYSLKLLGAGDFLLEVVPADASYIAQVYWGHDSLEDGNKIALATGQIQTIDFTLQRYIALAGKIQDVSGAGLANITVSALRSDSATLAQATTAPDGSFAIRLSAAGSYKLAINGAGSATFNPSYETSYYPDSPDAANAESFALSSDRPSVYITATLPQTGTYAQKQVSFHSDLAQVPEVKLLNYNQELGALPTLTYPGYTFLGWYDAQTDGTKTNPTLRIKADLDLWAYWSQNSYITISFNTYGAHPLQSIQKIAGVALGSLEEPVLSGHDFVGWYTLALGNGELVDKNSILTDDTTLYAHWLKTSLVTISFNPCGGKALDPISIDANNKYPYLPSTSKTGFSFVGWYTQSTGGQAIGSDYLFADNIELYAHWNKVEKDEPKTDDDDDGKDDGDDKTVPTKPVLTKSKNANLAKLKVTGAKLKGKFSAKKLSYKTQLAKGKSTLKIAVAKAHKSAKVYIKKANKKYKLASSLKVKLKVGKSAIVYIKVVAQDAKTAKVYKLKVSRKG